MFDAAAFSPSAFSTGSLANAASVALRVLVGEIGTAAVALPVVVGEIGAATLPVPVSVGDAGSASILIGVSVGDSGYAQVELSVSAIDDALLSGASSVCVGSTGHAAIWGPVVTVGGVNVEGSLIGDISIEAEVDAARIAELTLYLPPGSVVSLPAWTSRPVTIGVADMSSGAPRNTAPLFFGMVDTPAMNHAERSITLRCTDDLQGRISGMSQADITALISGRYSAAVFDASAPRWAYAQDLLSTVKRGLCISPTGELRTVSLVAGATPDITLDENRVGDQSLSVSIADRAGLVNEVVVAFDYRFPRVKAEGHRIGYHYVDLTGFAQYILDGKWWLQRAQVEAAIAAAGGTIESIAWDPLPTDIIAVGAGFWSPGPFDNTLCMGFTAIVSYDYAQTNEENHEIFVRAQRSIDLLGLRAETLSGALEGAYPDISQTESTIRLYQAEISNIAPLNRAAVLAERTNSAEVTLTADTDRAAANSAMETLIDIAKKRIYESHCRSRVSATVPLIAALDIGQTVRINADGIDARGVVRRVRHEMSSERGAATSTVEVAICALAGVGIVHDEDTTTAPAGTTAADTPLAPPVIVFANGAADDHSFTIEFPGVEASERDAAQSSLVSVVAAPLHEDLLTITI